MPAAARLALTLLPIAVFLSGFTGCSTNGNTGPVAAAPQAPATPAPVSAFPVMLGIDVLEAEGFASLRGMRVGLFTHPAGVNRRGESTVDVLRRAPGVQLVKLFAPEHGGDGQVAAGKEVANARDTRTGLPVVSLYNPMRAPTAAELRDIDVLVIDLQDIGVRSYTFATSMKYALEGCFRAGKPVIVLDRPNPLGGLKVDGPSLDANLKSGVGQFRVPYVHGLTMGELARMAFEAPGVLDIPDNVRAAGKLTIVPMRGWSRSMRWPDTGLTFVQTSPYVRDFESVIGYAMVGLGTSWNAFVRPGFSHGIGESFPFRGIGYNGRNADQLLADLQALRAPGIAFRKVNVNNRAGQSVAGVYVDVTDWDAWRPTELSFHLLRLNARLRGNNPFANLSTENARTLNIHIGSMEWYEALKRDGARVDVEGFVTEWQRRNAVYQEQTKRFWLYR